MKYIFITGGVLSGLGKGITVASISRLLKSKGYKVSPIKCDMYVNIDAGTMNPTVHGEVFVTDDGIETDQDLGHYERFLDVNLKATNYTTTGQVYQSVIQKERGLEYDGICVEVVPHIPEEIIRRIKLAGQNPKADIVIVEIGGTVGEYQGLLFLEAIRMMKLKNPSDVINIHVGYLPIPKSLGEMKSKPVQYSVRELNSAGIQPDFIVARAERFVDEKRREKISIFCNVNKDDIIANPDVESIYEVPLIFEKQLFAEKILKKLGLPDRRNNLKDWEELVETIKKVKKEVKIGIVGKYFATGDYTLEDSYVSVIEAIKHGAWGNQVKPKIKWIDSDNLDFLTLKEMDGLIVPGGFGKRGIEGKLKAIQYARENKVPFLGLCFGLQMAVVEFARNVCGLGGANSTEIESKTRYPVIDIMPEQKKLLKEKNYGATMRLGLYPCVLKGDAKAKEAYKVPKVYERHRHRYEVNPNFHGILRKNGLIFSGLSPDKRLVEIIEIKNHPFFLASQFHPEFKSRPNRPHPLFLGFVKACGEK